MRKVPPRRAAAHMKPELTRAVAASFDEALVERVVTALQDVGPCQPGQAQRAAPARKPPPRQFAARMTIELSKWQNAGKPVLNAHNARGT